MGSSIYYSTSDGTADAGKDYNTVTSGSVFVNGGETSVYISVGIIDDDDYDPVTMTLTFSTMYFAEAAEGAEGGAQP